MVVGWLVAIGASGSLAIGCEQGAGVVEPPAQGVVKIWARSDGSRGVIEGSGESARSAMGCKTPGRAKGCQRV